MKKLTLIVMIALAGGLILADNKKAEALDPASAALIATSLFFLPVLSAISHDHDRPVAYGPGAYPAPNNYGAYYDNPYPVQPRVYYSAPRYERYYAGNLNRGYGYERDWRRNRASFEDRRVRYYDRYRYARRY
jgi:hypothetical protein